MKCVVRKEIEEMVLLKIVITAFQRRFNVLRHSFRTYVVCYFL
jgi:hypothetical protein